MPGTPQFSLLEDGVGCTMHLLSGGAFDCAWREEETVRGIGRRHLLLMVLGVGPEGAPTEGIGGISKPRKLLFLFREEVGRQPTSDGFEFAGCARSLGDAYARAAASSPEAAGDTPPRPQEASR